KEVGKVYKNISLLILIKTIKYKAWQEKNFLYPKALVLVVIKILLEYLDYKVLEKYNRSY
ncbi:uncharacterized protein K444DRAFT_518616, partial [Hyaloscypha bicolor E]